MAKSRNSRAAATGRSKTSSKIPAKSQAAKKPPGTPAAKPAAGRRAPARRKAASLPPLVRAERLIAEAFDEYDPEQAIELAQRALKLSPDCADAYTVLSQYAADARMALQLCAAGVAAAERVLGPLAFEMAVGSFWVFEATRPYMRARLALAERLWDVGQRASAIEQLQELLRLNPHDHQGIRYVLARRLLEMGRHQELEPLLNHYDESSTMWAFSRVLAAFQREGDNKTVRQLLSAACKINKYVVPKLLEPAASPKMLPVINIPGSKDEAETYMAELSGGWRETAGAITWLRAVTAEAQRRKSAEPPAVGPSDLAKARLLRVPQRLGTEWQAAVYRLPTWVEEGGVLVRPWSILIVDHSENLILGQEMLSERPTPARLFDAIAATTVRPLIGKPHRPSEIQVIEDDAWEAIRPQIEEVGIDCIYRTSLDEIEYIQSQMQDLFLRDQQIPAVTEIDGIELPQIASFYAAAAEYYREAPWRRVPEQTAIRIDCDQLRTHRKQPWFAVVMGHSNITYSLAVYGKLETIREFWDAEFPAEATGQLDDTRSVIYSEAFEIPITDLIASEQQNLPVGGPEAYPLVVLTDRRSNIRQPEPWELQLLEGCLRSIPQFVAKHALIDVPAAETISVATVGGTLEMRLSWTPDFKSCGGDCDECDDDCEYEI
ncbi:MAG: hypothetical protein EXS05_20720 [Planctomycetaceae bacterium]|nr:hypothetical protein [Planctomycetaceae bacterium]